MENKDKVPKGCRTLLGISYTSLAAGAYLMFSSIYPNADILYIRTPKLLEERRLTERITLVQRAESDIRDLKYNPLDFSNNFPQAYSSVTNLESLCNTEKERLTEQLKQLRSDEDFIKENIAQKEKGKKFLHKFYVGGVLAIISLLGAFAADMKYKNRKSSNSST